MEKDPLFFFLFDLDLDLDFIIFFNNILDFLHLLIKNPNKISILSHGTMEGTLSREGKGGQSS